MKYRVFVVCLINKYGLGDEAKTVARRPTVNIACCARVYADISRAFSDGYRHTYTYILTVALSHPPLMVLLRSKLLLQLSYVALGAWAHLVNTRLSL